jgi:hypothetical protein
MIMAGTTLQDLLKQRDAKAEFKTLLGRARYGKVVSSTVTLINGRGHRLETNIVLHPGALGDRTRPYYFLAHCSILQPSARRKQKDSSSEYRSHPYSVARTESAYHVDKGTIGYYGRADQNGSLASEYHFCILLGGNWRDLKVPRVSQQARHG